MLCSTLFVSAVFLFQSQPPQFAPQSPDRSATERTKSPDAQSRIVIDGEFDDWKSISPVLVDPADARDAFVDFGEVRISDDDRFVHLLIDFGKTVNAQGLDGTAMILLDADGDAKTGRAERGMDGVDVIIDLTPPNVKSPHEPGQGMAIRSTTYQPDASDAQARKLTPYDIGLAFAPTHAGRRMEFRIDRGASLPNTPALFTGSRFTMKLVCLDLVEKLVDETEPITHAFQHSAKPQSGVEDQPNDPVVRAAGSDLRVLSWNAERGAIFSRPDPFRRTLAALKPDLILLQELTDKNSASQVQEFLRSAMPPQQGEDWNVAFGAGGGDLRCAIATRLDLHPIQTLNLIAFPNHPDRNVRAVGAMVSTNGGHMLAMSVHLKCCGRADGPEDQQRLAEVHAIHDAIKAIMDGGGVDGVVIAGDFNLVGSRQPLEAMAAGLDGDLSNLSIAQPYQIDGLSNATWSDVKQPFAPGRLDYMLFSDATIQSLGAFVYDSRDLGPRWLSQYHVEAADTDAASDHLPVVTDFHFVHKEN